jgi:membrane-associated phospholipid phosphatase
MDERLDTTNRRRFLAQVGAAALTSVAAPFASGGVSLEAAALGPTKPNQRAADAYRIRHDSAVFHKNQPIPPQETNGDDELFANVGYIGSFTKSLPHDSFGVVDPSAYQALLTALSTGNPADFDAIPQGGVAKLADPQSALAFQMDGEDSHQLAVRVPPAFASAEEAGEMGEVYWQALTRDVPFADYATDSTIATAAASLTSEFSDFRGPKIGGAVTPGTVFRGNTIGIGGARSDLIGPYISQFLAKQIPYGPFTLDQKVTAGVAHKDYMTDESSWLNIQNGGAAPAFDRGTPATNPPRYINNNRAMVAYLRADFSPEAFINAAQILLSFGLNALSPSNPYRISANQTGGSTFGAGDIVDQVAHASNLALKTCWFQKWSVHRRVRPEAFAGSLHNMKTHGGSFVVPIHGDLLNSTVLNAVHLATGTWLLPMAYPEGSPTHPAYPAGHAAFAGAGATILKAFFDETFVVPAPVVATPDGSALLPYAGGALTVGNELNKLASNIAVPRDAAGVHWRTDALEGMALGEAAAIALLQDMRQCYNERFGGFFFTKFDGTLMTI